MAASWLILAMAIAGPVSSPAGPVDLPAGPMDLPAGTADSPALKAHSPAGTASAPAETPHLHHNGLQVDREARTISFTATVQGEAFRNSLPPDHQYHAVVNREGGAAQKALFVTDADDGAIAATLRELGAQDGGGVPMSAWNYRWVPLVQAPASRVKGSRITVTVEWDGLEGSMKLEELLADSGGEGIEMRFGGNEEHDHLWESGCILCLFSCPGGVISNASYTIRDHQRSITTFEPGDMLPPDGTEVTITLALAPG